MFSKLLIPIAAGIPSLVLSSTIIYATSTSKRYSDMWVARFEDGGGSLLQCVGIGNKDKYDISLNVETKHQYLLVNVLKNSSEKMDGLKLGLKWTRNHNELDLIEINEENQYPLREKNKLATCKPVGIWSVKEEQDLDNGYWIGHLMTLSASLTLKGNQNCVQSLFKVECRVHVDSGRINTAGGKGAIKLEGKLPSLIYRPF